MINIDSKKNIFNSKKTICIKFGSTIIEGASVFLTL